ncbi:hypothetical protein E3A20_29410, partial [Planctomyces bekefii]
NIRNRGDLPLRQSHESTDPKHDTTLETLKNLHRIWRRPVHIETVIEEVKRRISYDGTNHQIEKL